MSDTGVSVRAGPPLRDTLLALADRCEAATGPGRELDGDIADATGWWIAERSRLGPFAPTVLDAAQFTASLDAAMGLVPEGHHTELAMQDRHSQRWLWTLRGGYGVRSTARAETPALSLCAAALRARAAMEDQ